MLVCGLVTLCLVGFFGKGAGTIEINLEDFNNFQAKSLAQNPSGDYLDD